jgi:hypothetical protein
MSRSGSMADQVARQLHTKLAAITGLVASLARHTLSNIFGI